MNKLKKLYRHTIFFIVVFIAMQIAVVAQVIEINYDFQRGNLGWTADFADYPPNIGTGYELDAGIRFMPRKLTRKPRRGFYLQGHNRSADLFMFFETPSRRRRRNCCRTKLPD